jgi:Ras-related protein Rab-5C
MARSDASVDVKVVFLGTASVGKTSIICRSVSDEFDPEMPATIGACYTAKRVEIANTKINLQIWDTAGQERFRTLAPMYYRGATVAILVYSIVSEASLEDVRTWADEIKRQTEELPALFVVGNKSDLHDERTVTTDRGEKLASGLGAFFAEVSAKTGRGIDELFVRVGEEAIRKGKIELTTLRQPPGPEKPAIDVSSTGNKGGGKGGCRC